MQILPTNKELLKYQAALPPADRQHKVHVEFETPIPAGKASEFYRIHLTQHHLTLGENDRGEENSFYEAEVFQPDRCGVKHCSSCKMPLAPVSLQVSICRNAKCPLMGREVVAGPIRGVVKVELKERYFVGTEKVPLKWRGRIVGKIEQNMISACDLVLDRRYPDQVLAGIFRAAKQLCESTGWKMKG